MKKIIKKLINIPTSTKKLIEYKEVNITAKELVQVGGQAVLGRQAL